MMTETIYLIRHATPDWERRDLAYHLPPGPPLTQQGLAEADALGAFLLSAGVGRLHASPLERALHTAQIAGEIAGVPVQVDERLIEWQPNEDAEKVHRRMWAALEVLRAEPTAVNNGNGRKPVGVVTHGGPIAVMLQAFGMDKAEVDAQRRFDRSNPLPPAAAWEAWREAEDEPWQLRLVFTPSGIEVAN